MAIRRNRTFLGAKPPVGAILDESHPINQGQVGCWLLNEGQGTSVINLVDRSAGTLVNSPTWVTGPYGPALSMVGSSSQRVDLGALKLGLSPQATIFASGTRTSGNHWVISFGSTVGNRFGILVYGGDGNVYPDFGVSYGSFSSGNVSPFTCGIVYDGNAASSFAARMVSYFNGVPRSYTTTSGIPGGYIASDDTAYIGFDPTPYYTTGTHDIIRIWSRALSADEISNLNSTPWLGVRDLIDIPRMVAYFYGAGGTFKPAWARRQGVIGSGVY